MGRNFQILFLAMIQYFFAEVFQASLVRLSLVKELVVRLSGINSHIEIFLN